MASTGLIEMMVAKALIKNDTFKAQFEDDASINTFLTNAVTAVQNSTQLDDRFGWMLSKSQYHRSVIDNPWYGQLLEKCLLKVEGERYVSSWVYVYSIGGATSGVSSGGVMETYSWYSYSGKTWWQQIYHQEDVIERPDDLKKCYYPDSGPYFPAWSYWAHALGETEDEELPLKIMSTTLGISDSWGVPILDLPDRVYLRPTEDGMPIENTLPKYEIDGTYIGDIGKYVIRAGFKRVIS